MNRPVGPGDLLLRVLAAFEGARVAYVVVGNPRGLPDRIEGDVDVVVPHGDYERLLHDPSAWGETSALVVQALTHERNATFFVLAEGEVGTDCSRAAAYLRVDICSDYRRRGRVLLRAEDLLRDRRRFQGDRGPTFWIPAPAIAFCYYLAKKIDKGSLAQGHGDYLSGLWRADPGGVEGAVERLIGRDEGAVVVRAAERGEWADVRGRLSTLRRTLHRRFPTAPSDWAQDQLRKARRARAPTGLVVALYGPDGAGKSSVLERVTTRVAPAFRRVRRFHLRPHFGRSDESAPPVNEPHSQRPRSGFMSLVKLLVWWVDYVAGYAFLIAPIRARSGLVVFDRYFHDVLVDPVRYRYGGSPLLARVVGRFVPAPDLTVLLDAPVEVLLERKREITEAEVARQRDAFVAMVSAMRDGQVVDASRPLDEVSASVERAILERLRCRTVRRLGWS